MLQDYFPALLQALAAIGFAAAALGLSVLLGKRGSHNEIKETPYECGMLPIGEGAPRFSVKFYLVAMLFVMVVVEVILPALPGQSFWPDQIKWIVVVYGAMGLLAWELSRFNRLPP